MKFSAVFATLCVCSLLAAGVQSRIQPRAPMAGFTDFIAESHAGLGSALKKVAAGIAKVSKS